MIVRNYTPFPPLYFESRDVHGRDLGVLVLRGTFNIVPGAALRPSQTQEPGVEADVWHGQPNASSVYMESDLAPFKPRTDILINAVAYAPGGRPLSDWNVRVQVGAVRKALHVTGPRAWVREGSGWRLEAPEPVTEVPIRYENAFGGIWRTSWGETRVCEENPVGVGFVEGEVPSGIDRIPAPQIESPDDPVVECGKRYRPEGLGPIARSWRPRLKRAGTFDDEWKKTRWPELPLDFDHSFYNAAHPDLNAAAFSKGDEEVVLDGLSPEGTQRFWLPACRMGCLITGSKGAQRVVMLFLDTIVIDLGRGSAFLTWRGVFGRPGAARTIDLILRRTGGR